MADISDLTTLDDVKAWITPTPDDSDDNLISRLITAASNFIHRYLSRYLHSTNYIELRDGTGGQRLVFANFPVTDVSSVTVGARVISPAPDFIAAGYLFTPRAITLRGFRFYRALQNVELRYTAGYTNIPTEISQACIELVTLRYRDRSREGLAQESVVGVATETFSIQDVTPSIQSGLDPFRQVVPVAASGSFAVDPIY